MRPTSMSRQGSQRSHQSHPSRPTSGSCYGESPAHGHLISLACALPPNGRGLPNGSPQDHGFNGRQHGRGSSSISGSPVGGEAFGPPGDEEDSLTQFLGLHGGGRQPSKASSRAGSRGARERPEPVAGPAASPTGSREGGTRGGVCRSGSRERPPRAPTTPGGGGLPIQGRLASAGLSAAQYRSSPPLGHTNSGASSSVRERSPSCPSSPLPPGLPASPTSASSNNNNHNNNHNNNSNNNNNNNSNNPSAAGLNDFAQRTATPRGFQPSGNNKKREESSSKRAAAVSVWGPVRGTRTAAFVSLASDPNESFRSYMEDGHFVADPIYQSNRRGQPEEHWGYFAVYDGHGGRQSVDYCEGKLHDLVLNELCSATAGHINSRKVLTDAFGKVDAQLAMLGAWNNGCTATVALVQRQATSVSVHVGNVGDSRAILVLPGGCKRLTVDHRACDPEEARRVASVGGMVRHGRVAGQLSVSRSLGDHHLKDGGVSCVPDVSVVTLETADACGAVLLIASDGLWDAFKDEEAAELLRCCVTAASSKTSDAEAVAADLKGTAAETLVRQAKERGSRDNILALAVFL